MTVDDLIFGAKTPEQRIADFDNRIAMDLLGVFDVPTEKRKALAREYGTRFDCQAVCSYLGLPLTVLATRLSSYSFEEVFHKTSTHPLLKAFLNVEQEHPNTDTIALVIRAYTLGKVVVTTVGRRPDETTPIIQLIARDGRAVYIHHFKPFFSSYKENE